MAERMAENAHDSWARKKKLELESLGRLHFIKLLTCRVCFLERRCQIV